MGGLEPPRPPPLATLLIRSTKNAIKEVNSGECGAALSVVATGV